MKILLLSIVAFLACLPAQAGEPPIRIGSAWIPEAPPTARMLAGYLEISNSGKAPIAVVDVESDAFGKVEMHHTEQVDGVARMRRQTRIEISPGETVSFEPGGLHLMLMRPGKPLRAGDTVELYLVDEHGREYPFTAEVRKREL